MRKWSNLRSIFFKWVRSTTNEYWVLRFFFVFRETSDLWRPLDLENEPTVFLWDSPKPGEAGRKTTIFLMVCLKKKQGKHKPINRNSTNLGMLFWSFGHATKTQLDRKLKPMKASRFWFCWWPWGLWRSVVTPVVWASLQLMSSRNSMRPLKVVLGLWCGEGCVWKEMISVVGKNGCFNVRYNRITFGWAAVDGQNFYGWEGIASHLAWWNMEKKEFFVHLFWVNLRPISSYSEERQCVALDDVEVPELGNHLF